MIARLSCSFLIACGSPSPVAKLLFSVQGATLLAQTGGSIYGVGSDGLVWRYLKSDGSHDNAAQADGVRDFVAMGESIFYTQPSEVSAGGTLRLLGSNKRYATGVLNGSLRADASALYWIAEGAIMRMSGGGMPQQLATGTPDTPELAVDDTHVYWFDHSLIRRVGKSGGTAETVLFGANGTQLQTAGELLFYFGDGVVYSVKKTGGTPRDLTRGPTRIWALDDLFYTIYDSRYGDEQALWTMLSDGTNRRSLVYDLGTVSQLQLVRDADTLYWTDGSAFWSLKL